MLATGSMWWATPLADEVDQEWRVPALVDRSGIVDNFNHIRHAKILHKLQRVAMDAALYQAGATSFPDGSGADQFMPRVMIMTTVTAMNARIEPASNAKSVERRIRKSVA